VKGTFWMGLAGRTAASALDSIVRLYNRFSLVSSWNCALSKDSAVAARRINQVGALITSVSQSKRSCISACAGMTGGCPALCGRTEEAPEAARAAMFGRKTVAIWGLTDSFNSRIIC